MLLLAFFALATNSAHGQTFLGLPLADSVHMSTGTVAIAADDEDNGELWSMFYRNAYHELGHLDPVLISPERDTIELPEWTTTFTVGSGYLFTTGNHGPGDPDIARHWLFIWNKHGRLLRQLPMNGTVGVGGPPYEWRPEGDVISLCDISYNPHPVFDNGEKGHFYLTSFRYGGLYKATIFEDSVWVDSLQFVATSLETHSDISVFGVVHDRAYRGGSWLFSEVAYPPTHSPVFIVPDTFGHYWIPEEDILRPRIGEIWSISGNLENGLWIMGEWPPDGDYGCTAYLFQNSLFIHSTISQAQTLVPSLFPNPTNSWFVLSGLSARQHDIVIYNLLGQMIYQIQVNSTTAHIEALWPTGPYFVQVDNLPVLKLQLIR